MLSTLRAILTAIAGPLFSWCLALLGAWIAQRRADKNSEREHQANLQAIKDNVNFISGWWHAYNEISGSTTALDSEKAAAIEHLQRLLQSFSMQQQEYSNQRTIVKPESSFFRSVKWILLWHAPKTRTGKLLRVAYYLVGVFCLLVGPVLAITLRVAGASMQGVTYTSVLVLFPDILLIALLLCMRWIVREVDDWMSVRKVERM